MFPPLSESEQMALVVRGRALLVELPTDLAAEILIASETALGPVRDMFAN